MDNKPTYRQLIVTFLKIGAFTFGGGYAMISLIENELVTKNRWIDKDTFYEYLSIAQMSPGILAVNISILMGNLFFGKKGAVVCVIATCTPAFMTILLIAIFFVQFKDNNIIGKIFKGIRPIVVALIAMPVFSLCKKAKIGIATAFIPLIIIVLVVFLKVSPIYIIVVAVAAAIVWATTFAKEIDAILSFCCRQNHSHISKKAKSKVFAQSRTNIFEGASLSRATNSFGEIFFSFRAPYTVLYAISGVLFSPLIWHKNMCVSPLCQLSAKNLAVCSLFRCPI